MRFDATVDMVEALLPHVTISATTEPSIAQVMVLLGIADGEVNLALGSLATIQADPTLNTFYQVLLDQASRLVALLAAAFTFDSKFPERAGEKGALGTVLTARYDRLVGGLQRAANEGTDTPGGELAPSQGPAWRRPGQGSPDPDNPLFIDILEPRPDINVNLGAGGDLEEQILDMVP